MKQKKVIIVDGSVGASYAAFQYMRKHNYEAMFMSFDGPVDMAIQSLYALPHSIQYYMKEEELNIVEPSKLFFGISYAQAKSKMLEGVNDMFLGAIAVRTINTNKFNEAFVFNGCIDHKVLYPIIDNFGVENVSVISCVGSELAVKVKERVPSANTVTLPQVDNDLLHTLICGTIKTHFNLEDPA